MNTNKTCSTRKPCIIASSCSSKNEEGFTGDFVDVSEPFDVVVVGGGPAGLAVAAASAESGSSRLLVLEREEYPGGVLPQCVHDGFGLYLYEESLTGPEFAQRWIDRTRMDGVPVACACTVLSIENPSPDGFFHIDALGVALGGRVSIRAYSVVCATGCRERTRGALQIPGGRPAGVITAGSAQYMVNVANQLPGDKVVVLGSGDIGLIMARRMTLEGAEVRLVLGQEATGLVRNHIRCIQDFDIPIRYGWGLMSIHGYGQLQGVTVAPLHEDGSFDESKKEYIRCNVLMVACGLIPEREVLGRAIPDIDDNGSVRDVPGLFVCGNANVPHDLVDQVVQEGIRVGLAAGAVAARARGAAAPKLPADLDRMANIRISEPKGRMNEVSSSESGVQCVVCTVCPTGCVMEVSDNGEITGNTCLRGRDYAMREIVSPTRIFTGTVGVAGQSRVLVPVRTAQAVPKSSLFDIACACRKMAIHGPVTAGQVLCENIANAGAALVATGSYADEASAAVQGGAHGTRR